MLRSFSVAVSVSPHVCFGFCVSGIVHLWVGGLPSGPGGWVSGGRGGAGGGAGGCGWSAAGWLGPPSSFYCWPSQGGSSVLVLW